MRTHLDLFSGIGGFALAARMVGGIKTIGYVENDKYCQKILRKQFGAVLADPEGRESRKQKTRHRRQDIGRGSPFIHGDIRTFDGGTAQGAWLVTGGFPCQPFSCSGKRRGKADDRHLWPEMARVIAEARPAWVLAENVPGIVGMELDTVLSDLEGLGYEVGTVLVPAAAADAPHRRERVWIVGHSCSTQSVKARCWHKSQRGEAIRFGGASGGANVVHGEGKGPEEWEEQSARQKCKTAQRSRSQELLGRGKGTGSIHVWPTEPDVGRVAHGVPRRVDRLRALGNAIVPQVAAEMIRMMIQVEEKQQQNSSGEKGAAQPVDGQRH